MDPLAMPLTIPNLSLSLSPSATITRRVASVAGVAPIDADSSLTSASGPRDVRGVAGRLALVALEPLSDAIGTPLPVPFPAAVSPASGAAVRVPEIASGLRTAGAAGLSTVKGHAIADITSRTGRRGKARGNCRYAFPASTAPTNQSPASPRLTPTVAPHGTPRLVTSGGAPRMSRPVPVSGQLETTIVDFGTWKRRALADKRLDEREAGELLVITERMVRSGNVLLRSVQFVTRVLTGGKGMDSDCVRRQWDDRQAELAYLDDYRTEPHDAA